MHSRNEMISIIKHNVSKHVSVKEDYSHSAACLDSGSDATCEYVEEDDGDCEG